MNRPRSAYAGFQLNELIFALRSATRPNSPSRPSPWMTRPYSKRGTRKQCILYCLRNRPASVNGEQKSSTELSMRKCIAALVAVTFSMLSYGLAVAGMRCAYYVGIGYHCFGDKGGPTTHPSPGRDDKTSQCGLFDPGCKATASKARRPTAPKAIKTHRPSKTSRSSTVAHELPQSNKRGWKSPIIGPGYIRPNTYNERPNTGVRP